MSREHYMHQPAEVSLETLSVCNAACTFCPYETIERKGNKMSDEMIDDLINQMSRFETPFYFSPFKVSDPLLDVRLFDILEKIDNKTKATSRIFTNGSALTWENIERLHNVQRLELWVSFNEHREDEYKNLMNLDYHRTLKNIDQLHESDFCHQVYIARVGVDKEFKDFCQNRWPDFQVVTIKKDGWLGYTDPEFDEIPDEPCSRWYELSIMSTGIVSHCCMDGNGDYPIGDLNKQTLLEVYNDPSWKERREKNLSRKDIHPCATCTY